MGLVLVEDTSADALRWSGGAAATKAIADMVGQANARVRVGEDEEASTIRHPS